MSFISIWNTVNNLGSYILSGGASRRLVTLSCDGDKMTLPVTPSKYSVTTSQNNKTVDILEFGEAQLFGNPQLTRLSFETFFPATKHEYPFVVGDSIEPTEAVEKIKKWKESKKPVRVIITDSPFNMMMAIKSFNWKEQDGSRDIYYSLSFIEWKDLNTNSANNDKPIDEKTGLKKRSVESTPPKPDSVKKAKDILEASKKAYGQFKYWRGIANANGLKMLALKNVRSLIINKKGTTK